MKDLNKIAENIKKFRKHAGLSQTELAEKSGITASAVSMIEAGIRSPSLVISLKISDALKVSVSELTDEDNAGLEDNEYRTLYRQVGGFQSLSVEDQKIVKQMIKHLSMRTIVPDISRAKDLATEILEDFGLNKLPISVESVCKSINGENMSINITEKELSSESVDGMVSGNKNHADIIINSRIKNANRREFTKAHELGHVLLHIVTGKAKKFQSLIDDTDRSTEKAYEKEANAFAAALLMPSRIIKPMYTDQELTWKLVEEMHNACKVSLEAMARRLIELSNEACCLITHKDGRMWTPVKSQSFNLFVPEREFPKNLDYIDDKEPIPTNLRECTATDWGIDSKNSKFFYSSIHNEQFNKSITLLLVKEPTS